MEIAGKKIIITGSSSGIGESLARQLSKQGAKIALFARRIEKLEKISDEIKTYNPDVLAIKCDVKNKESTEKAINEVINEFNGIDILINNAGQGYFGTIENMDTSDLYHIIETNVIGPVHLIQASMPYLKQSKGMIVNISSSLSKRALPFLSYYAGTKSMLDAISDGLRLESKYYDIKVFNYCPPETDTEFHSSSIKEKGMDKMGSGRKFMKADDVAKEIINGIKKEKREIVKGKFLKIMDFIAPKFLDMIFYKSMVLNILEKKE